MGVYVHNDIYERLGSEVISTGLTKITKINLIKIIARKSPLLDEN